MGLIYANARRLWDARQSGVSFERTLTIGRLQICLHPSELRQLRRLHPSGTSLLAGYRFGEYADRFWRDFIGVRELASMDISDFEGADIIHDLNQPVPQELWEKFDVVVEAGTIEHIFNFPVAAANLMRMVRVGGSVFLTTVANNLCGHGFYQFSPELIYRVFSPENGFDATKVHFLQAASQVVETVPIARSYEVVDPKTVGCRVGLQSTAPVMMMVESRKARSVEPFASAPQQSDYAAAWQKSGKSRSRASTLARAAFDRLPQGLRRKLTTIYLTRQYSLANRRFYRADKI
jgi:hypothetical protein